MKKFVFTSILIFIQFSTVILWGQQKLDLTDCRKLARENYPRLKQSELFQKINELKVANNKTAYLPQIDLKGQATYQSDVTALPIDLSKMGITIPSLAQDQYKMYLDVKQTIWDGGITSSKNQMESATLESDLQKIEVEAYQINSMVDAYFFNLMIVGQSQMVLSEQMAVLEKQVERIQNASKYGAAREKDVEKLVAEKLMLQQKQIDLASKKRSIVAVLSVLTGTEIEQGAIPVLPESGIVKVDEIVRPEFKLFELQQKQLVASDKLLSATRMPLVYGFGQAGYGRPGMNMLSNEFETYYMVGVGVSWRITDWSNVSRNKKINGVQREIIGTIQSDFEQKQKIQLADASSQITNLKQLIASDEELIGLRKKIVSRASSELENGVVTSTDFLSDMNAETVARINYETHKIQLEQAIVNYYNILGK